MTLRSALAPNALVFLGALVLLQPLPANAGKGDKDKDANVAVEGDVALPPSGVKEPMAQFLGFIDRIANPITGLRPFDPRPECFVFLDGGPAAADASKPENRTIEWKLESQTFTPSIKPFVVGQRIQIRNAGKNTHPLYTDTPGVFEGTDAVGPGGVRPLTIKDTAVSVVIRSQDSPHLEGRAVALPTRYFAPLKRDGSFKIDDVPAGTWTLHVWYHDGWLTSAAQKIEVGPKMARVKVALPEKLDLPDNADKGGK